jgi:hypothetical protein
VFKFLKRKKVDQSHSQLDLIYPPAFAGVHSSDLSLVTVSALYVPIIQYSMELAKIVDTIENHRHLSPINYRHNAVTVPVSSFFLTKDLKYGQEVSSLESFIENARRYYMHYERLNLNITDNSDRPVQLLVLSKVTADLNQLIYSLVSVNQML